MEAKKDLFKNFITQQISMSIPIYQRGYSWRREEWEELWNDIKEVGLDSRESYFIGSIVFKVTKSELLETNQNINIIDGQQRITTLTILICSLCSLDIINPEDKKTLFNNYIINNNNEKTRKLSLRREDDKTLEKIINSIGKNQKPKFNQKDSTNIKGAYNYFISELKKTDYKIIEKGLNKLLFVSVKLEAKDKQQLIFESLNSTGKALNNSDLIRNYVLMGSKNQNKLYDDYWKPIENGFINKDEGDFDDFIFNYLTIKKGVKITKAKTYKEFKLYQTKSDEEIEYIVKDIYKYAEYYFKIVYEKEEDEELREAFKSINTLKFTVVYRFLLNVYNDYEQSKDGDPNINLSKKDFIKIIEIIESYLLRRFICDIPTHTQNTTFIELNSEIDKKDYLNSVISYLTQYAENETRRFPKDKELKESLKTRVFKGKNNITKYILGKIENYDNKEKVDIESITLEHIMPQNLNYSWQRTLGKNYEEIHSLYLNNIGNLTLTFYNSEMSNKPFKEKQKTKGGFNDSKLKLNHYLTTINEWNQEEILKRSEKLSEEIIEIWKYPLPQNTTNNTDDVKPLMTYTFSDKAEKLYNRLDSMIEKTSTNIEKKYKSNCIQYTSNNQNIMEIVPFENKFEIYFDIPIEEIPEENRCESIISEMEEITGTTKVDFDNISQVYFIIYIFKKTYERIK